MRIFGRLICRQLRQMWDLLGGGPFTVAEQGAGEGHLALDILNAAAEDAEFYRQSALSAGGDQSRCPAAAAAVTCRRHRERVDWCAMEDLAGMEGCFLSNELVDAFPVHLVEKRDGELREVFVVNRRRVLPKNCAPFDDPAIAEHLRRLRVDLAEGNRAEINLEAPRWMETGGGDPGARFRAHHRLRLSGAELFAPYRTAGTLMCYFQHTTSEDPYQRVGCQDITAHVDFTALEQAGEGVGLKTLWFGEQYRFLLALGFLEDLLQLAGAWKRTKTRPGPCV